MGIKTPLENVWSIGLGSQVVTPLEQTNFYSTIARGGIRRDPRAVSTAITPGGTKLQLKYPKGFKVLEDWQADTIRSILRDNVTGGTGVGASSIEDAAGKTGTTDDAKDAWFCGMTPELTACVWMGFNIPTPMPGAAGGGIPTSIWRDFMRDALPYVPNRTWFEPKSEPVWLPWDSGKWATDLGLDVAMGADPSKAPKPTDEDAKDEDAAGAPADGTGEVPGGTAPPADPGAATPVEPTPVEPAPAPEPVAPAPAPVALVRAR
jgi:penicillin-binding protein 1A